MPSCWEILPPSSSREAGCRSSPPAGQGPGFTGHSRRRADNRLPQAQGEWRPAQGDRASGIPKAFTGTCSAVSALSPPVIQVVPPLPPFPRRVAFWGGPHSLPPNTLTYVPPRSHRVVSRGRGTAHGLPAPAQGRGGIVPGPWPPGPAACGFWRLKGSTALLRFPYPRGRPRLEIGPGVWRFEGGCFRLGVPRPLSPLAGCGGLWELRSPPTPPGTAHMTRREKDVGASTRRCFPGGRDPGGLPPPLGCCVDF